MTSEEIQAIKDIEGTSGFRAIEFYVKQKMEKLDSVQDLDVHANVDIGTQALARKEAVRLLSELLSDLQLNALPQVKRKTYE